jgi:hypothetical protein
MDDPTKSPESAGPSSVEVSTEEDKVSAELAKAQEAIRDGTASPEDHARVAGFEAGAAAAVEMAKASIPEQTPVATEDINSDDMLGAVLRRIERQQDDITQRSFGEDTSELKRNLQVDLDLRDYLKSRQFKDADGNTIDPQTGLPKLPEQPEITNQNDKRYFEDESLNNLINKWAEADKNKDRTTSTDAQDEILERLIRQPNLTPEHQTQLLDMIRDRMEAKRKALDGGMAETTNPAPTENVAEVVSDPVAKPVEIVVTPVEKPTQETTNNVPDPANFILVGGQAKQAEALAAAQAGKVEQKPESMTIVETDKPENLVEVKPQSQEIAEKPKDKEVEELIFAAGRDKGSLAELVHRAMEIADLDQKDRQSAKGIRGILQKVVGGIKYSTIFKAETQRKRAEELMFAAKEKMGETGRESLTIEEWTKVLDSEGITMTSGQETAFLVSISDDIFEKGEGFAIHSETGEESKEMGDLRQSLKGNVLDYVIAAGAEGLSDEQRSGLLKQYSESIGASVDKFMENNHDFTREELNVYADNARQLLERCLATSKSDGGIEQVDGMLDNMRIDIGQRQLGAYNNINTEHMKRTMELAKNLRVGSAISKATFVVSTWVAAGALTSGVAVWGGQSGSKNASKILGTTVGGILGGPIGAGIGLAVGVGVSAAWGRHLGRRRASDNADLAATSNAYAGGPELTEQLKKLSPDVIKYTDATLQLNQFLELKPGIAPEVASIHDWQIKTDLSSADLAAATVAMARIQANLNQETEYNVDASAIAEAESGRGSIAAIFRSQATPEGRALNLFQATDRGSFLSERLDMMLSLQTLSDGLKNQYANVSIELPVINGKEPTLVSVSDYLKMQLVEQGTAAEKVKNKYLEKVQDEIDRAGRKAAITAGIASLAVGVGSAAVRELATGGGAHTIFDAFQNEPKINHDDILPIPGGSVKGGATEIVTGQNFGKSGVEIRGSQAIFSNYKGEHVAVTLGAQGQLTPDDINTLNAHEIVVNQVTSGGTQGQVPIEQLAKQAGATEYKTTAWLDNGTVKPDGTEVHAYLERTANGGLHLAQRGGIATGNGMSVDIVEAAKHGQVYARVLLNDGTAVKIPGVVENGSVVANISPDSPYAALFTGTGDHVQTLAKSWGWTFGDINSPTGNSISTELGQNVATVPINIPGKTVINVFEKIPKAVAAVVNAGRTFVGVMPTGTDTVLDKQKPEEKPPVVAPAPIAVEGNNTGEALAIVNNPGEALVSSDNRGEALVTVPDQPSEETLVTVSGQPSEALAPTFDIDTSNATDMVETTATAVNDQPVVSSPQTDNSGGGDYGSSNDAAPTVEASGRGSSAFNIVRNMPFKVTAKGVDRKIKPGMVLDQLGNGSYLIRDVDGQLQTYTKAEMGNWLENGFISLI